MKIFDYIITGFVFTIVGLIFSLTIMLLINSGFMLFFIIFCLIIFISTLSIAIVLYLFMPIDAKGEVTE